MKRPAWHVSERARLDRAWAQMRDTLPALGAFDPIQRNMLRMTEATGNNRAKIVLRLEPYLAELVGDLAVLALAEALWQRADLQFTEEAARHGR